MADLLFFTGPMDCGKSTLALQMDHTQKLGGRRGELFTSHDRSGQSVITSRLGLSEPATDVDEEFDFWQHVVHRLTSGERCEYLICDEAQFYTPVQIDQLARVADELDLDVFAFGILSDFRTEMFPASKRLVELADRLETLQIQPLCWCGQRGTHNARTVNGKMVVEGSQVVVGDTTAADTPAENMPVVAYEVLCRRHHRRRVSRQVALATFSPEPLPFGSPEQEE